MDKGDIAPLTAEQETACLWVDPFESGKGDCVYRTLSDRFVAARKEHKCAICFGPVAPGERHRVIKEASEDMGLTSMRLCAECCKAMADYEMTYGDEALDTLEARYGLGEKRAREARDD